MYKDAAPIIEKSNKFLELHSIFAPKSNTTLIPFLLGHKLIKLVYQYFQSF